MRFSAPRAAIVLHCRFKSVSGDAPRLVFAETEAAAMHAAVAAKSRLITANCRAIRIQGKSTLMLQESKRTIGTWPTFRAHVIFMSKTLCLASAGGAASLEGAGARLEHGWRAERAWSTL